MTPQEWIKGALPCPFCGAAPDYNPKDPERHGDAWATVFCRDEDCPANQGANVTNMDDDENFHPVEEAVKLWNKRSAPEGATHLAAALEEITEIRKASAWIVDCEKWDSGTQLLNEKAVAQARIEHRRSSMQVSPTLPPSIEAWMMLVARRQGRDESAEEIARLRAEAGRVVVPELAPDGMSTAAFVDGYRFAASRAHSVPSSRVLKDGEVAVDAGELAALRKLFSAAGNTIANIRSGVTIAEINDAWAGVCSAQIMRTQATATESGEKGGA